MFTIRRVDNSVRDRVVERISLEWGSTMIVSRGRVHRAEQLPGFVAMEGETIVGLVTYRISAGECEIVTLDSWAENKGIGSSLLDSVIQEARSRGCSRVWLITTNDNTAAMRFYQKRSFRMCALHVDAVMEARLLKPQIPLVGCDGIPIVHEIEFDMLL